MDGLWARGENETPNPKHQAPEKSQTSNSKTCRRLAALELGTWSFFGVWSLEFGALIGGRISPLPAPLPTSAPWGEGIDHRLGGDIKMRPGHTGLPRVREFDFRTDSRPRRLLT